MVRFIISLQFLKVYGQQIFTFQYGQIYYKNMKKRLPIGTNIYIPIWLDLLLIQHYRFLDCLLYLHSNMVRFIIHIYTKLFSMEGNLHSNMVRFIIYFILYITNQNKKFTFQYGQIYYFFDYYMLVHSDSDLHSNMVRFII